MSKKTKITTRGDKNSTFGQKPFLSLLDTERCFSIQLTDAASHKTMNWVRENSDPSFTFG